MERGHARQPSRMCNGWCETVDESVCTAGQGGSGATGAHRVGAVRPVARESVRVEAIGDRVRSAPERPPNCAQGQ